MTCAVALVATPVSVNANDTLSSPPNPRKSDPVLDAFPPDWQISSHGLEAPPAYGPSLPRTTTDRPDDVTGPQLHVMYALPSDGVDRALDVNGTLKNTITSFQTWLVGKDGGRPLRF